MVSAVASVEPVRRFASDQLVTLAKLVLESAFQPIVETGTGTVFGYESLMRGFDRIGAVGAAADGSVVDHRGEQRMRGFEDELRFSGRDTSAVLRHGKAPLDYDHGAGALTALLEAAPDVEAVFAVSDLSAVGVVMECQRRGIDVPGQISVIGFGDFAIGRIINPPLTTIHVDFTELGRRTGNTLVALLAADGDVETEPGRVDVGLTIIERESVRQK